MPTYVREKNKNTILQLKIIWHLKSILMDDVIHPALLISFLPPRFTRPSLFHLHSGYGMLSSVVLERGFLSLKIFPT